MSNFKSKLVLKFLIVSSILTGCHQYETEFSSVTKEDINITESNFSDVKQTLSNFSFIFKVKDKEQFIKLESSIIDGQLNSNLLFKEKNSSWVKYSEFNLNLSDKDHKKNINNNVIILAKSLKSKCNSSEIGLIENYLDQLPKTLFNKLTKKEYFNELSLSIFYHLAVFKTAKRAYEKDSENCNCGVNDSFINNESPFFCAEDILLSVKEVQVLLENLARKDTLNKNKFIPHVTMHYLESTRDKVVCTSKIEKMLRDEYKYYWDKKLTSNERNIIISKRLNLLKVAQISTSTNSEIFPIDPFCLLLGVGAGSDCGCCGNYSGPCIYCSLVCLDHDYLCVECTPEWFCLSGCVPGPYN